MHRLFLLLPLLALAAGCASTGTLVEHDGVAYWRVHCPRRLVEGPWDVILSIPTNYPGAVYSTVHHNGTHLLNVRGSVAYFDRDFNPLPTLVGNHPDADKNHPNVKKLREYDRWIDPSGTMILDLFGYRFDERPPGGIVHIRYLGEAEQFMVAERKLSISLWLK